MAASAWESFGVGGENLNHAEAFTLRRIRPPYVSTNDTAQFGLAAIQNLALIGDYLPVAAATPATDAPLEVPAS